MVGVRESTGCAGSKHPGLRGVPISTVEKVFGGGSVPRVPGEAGRVPVRVSAADSVGPAGTGRRTDDKPFLESAPDGFPLAVRRSGAFESGRRPAGSAGRRLLGHPQGHAALPGRPRACPRLRFRGGASRLPGTAFRLEPRTPGLEVDHRLRCSVFHEDARFARTDFASGNDAPARLRRRPRRFGGGESGSRGARPASVTSLSCSCRPVFRIYRLRVVLFQGMTILHQRVSGARIRWVYVMLRPLNGFFGSGSCETRSECPLETVSLFAQRAETRTLEDRCKSNAVRRQGWNGLRDQRPSPPCWKRTGGP